MTIEINNLDDLLEKHRDAMVFETISGSIAYGTNHAKSDVDIRGIYVLPEQAYLNLKAPLTQVSDEKGDIVYYTIQRFIELAASANPNIIEMLYMPDECIRYSSPIMQRLIEYREMFISRKAYKSHIGYAQAQIKKARGQNKWVNNPQPEEPPSKESFCYVIPRDDGELPFRSISLQESEINLRECHCASLEHSPGMYRLYDYGDEAKGVFRNDMLVCESIPLDDESRCVGILIFNKTAYERALSNHKNYWKWRRERNDHRWISQENGSMDYDAKNLMHTFRLLLSGENILRYGEPIVRFTGEKLTLLKDILAGKFEYDQLIKMVEEKTTVMAELHEQCTLPDESNAEALTTLLREMTEKWETQNA